MPSTKSVGATGIGIGSQRNWLGVVATSSNGVERTIPFAIRSYGRCMTEGRMRYVQVRRFRCLGAVNGVPESCSV